VPRALRNHCAVECAARYAGVGVFGVGQMASFVNVFVGEADFSRKGKILVWNPAPVAAALAKLSAVYGSIIFFGQPALGSRFDVERVGLRTISRGLAAL
jgi:hypothetical protein